MVAGGQGAALEVFREGQAEEQECLFYVALSRARDRLLLYSPTKKANGHNRPASPFIGRLGAGIFPTAIVPGRRLPPPADEQPIRWVFEGKFSFTAPQIALCESCARRFFYTHLLQIGGRRTLTDFMRMHDAVRTVFEGIVAGTVQPDDLEARLATECDAQGLAGHGYAADYQAFAVTMIRFFLSTRQGLRAEAPVALRLAFADQEIIVRPDDVVVRGDGRRILRRVRTGHRRAAEAEDVGAAAFLLAARQAFPDAEVELVYLADQETVAVDLSARKLATRQAKLASFLANIRAGSFPANPSAWTCPGCPAFFICGATPPGTLHKKF
jgi:hypothetical protein